jgi:competence protein ComEA
VSLTRVGLTIIALVAAIVAVYALFQAFDARTAPPIVIEDAAGIQPVVVDVRGAVSAPGVYELVPGARIQDAILAAGGLSPTADLSTVNLARRLRDGEVVTILELPRVGAAPATPPSDLPTGDSAASTPVRLNLNTATIAELTELPGIGDVIAERIVRFREENGPFRSVDDLILVEGISTRTIEGFRDLVTVRP